jgi:hypothetical protein
MGCAAGRGTESLTLGRFSATSGEAVVVVTNNRATVAMMPNEIAVAANQTMRRGLDGAASTMHLQNMQTVTENVWNSLACVDKAGVSDVICADQLNRGCYSDEAGLEPPGAAAAAASGAVAAAVSTSTAAVAAAAPTTVASSASPAMTTATAAAGRGSPAASAPRAARGCTAEDTAEGWPCGR